MNRRPRPFIKSKLRVPRPCRYSLERTSLLRQLQTEEAGVLVFHGKAGAGKTELARQYCYQSQACVLWYSLDESDNDSWQFLAGFQYLFSELLEWPSEEAWLYPEVLGVKAALGNLLSDIIDRMEMEPKQQYILVLDALEAIHNERILDFIRRIISILPDNLNLIITTKGIIPDFLSRYVTNGICLVLSEAELAFQDTEQQDLTIQIMAHAKSLAQHNQILEPCKTLLEGWPAGLVLVLSYISKYKFANRIPDWAAIWQDSMLNSFISYEIVQRLSTAEQDFLTYTFHMPELQADICDYALGIDNSEALIRRLLNLSLLCCQSRDKRTIVRHHEALRLYLKAQAERSVLAEITRKSAVRYLVDGNYVLAVNMAAEIYDTELITQIMETSGSEMLNHEDDQLLSDCVRYLETEAGITGSQHFSGSQLSPGPEVLGIAAQYYYKSNQPELMERYLNQADSFFGKENKYGMYRGLYKGLMKFQADPERYEKQIRNALFLLAEHHYGLPYLKSGDRQLLDRLAAEKDQEQPGKLKVTFFGDFQVTVLNEQKTLSWRTRKGGELFACLVALGGQAVGRKQLLQKLWSDELPDNAVTMLHNILYNIRKELAVYQMEDLIQYKDKVYCINMAKIETDLTEIQHLCTLIEQNNIPGLSIYKERFTAYWGRYLEDMDSPWLAELREYYDARFVQGCTLLADDAAAAGQLEAAVRLLKNAMVVNSYSEELAGNLLRCYGAMRNLKMVKIEYERFASLLERDLEVRPSQQLTKVYKEVTKQQ